MAGLREYKCPECGGPLQWGAAVQKMQCPYCDSLFTIEELNRREEENGMTPEEEPVGPEEVQGEQEAQGAPEAGEGMPHGEGDTSNVEDIAWESESAYFSEEETQGLHVYSCQSCGAQIIGDDTLGATSCPYCSNNVVMTGQFAGDLKPDVVIPFAKDRQFAKAQFRQYVNSRRFVPKVFSKESHIEEMKAVYVPFWLFDAVADVDVMYNATKTSTRRNNTTEFIDTSHFVVERGGDVRFEHVPVDGSKNIADDLMESIEPFDYKDAVPFHTAYLAGYLAERYDVKAEDCVQKAYSRMNASARNTFDSTVTGYDSKNVTWCHIDFKEGKTSYALYPVYLLNTTWNGVKYLFAMNGQTGKFTGDLPMDKTSYYRQWAILAVVLGLMLYAGMWFIGMF